MKANRFLLIILAVLLVISVILNISWYQKDSIQNQLSNAEKLFDLKFSPAQRDSMADAISGYIEKYKEIHKYKLDNSDLPSIIFSPVPVYYKFDQEQKKIEWNLPKEVVVPENKEQLCYYTVAELSVLIKGKKITSEELTKIYIERLKKFNPELHCVVTLLEDRAIEQAKKADAEIAKGIYRGPLHGIPYGVKDLLALKGYPFTYGSKIYKNQIPEITSPVIQKLDDAGAILVAKFSLGELAT